MRRPAITAAAACGFAIAAALQSPPANAASLAVTCEERDAGKPATMTIAYEGEAAGTLKISGSFGEMSLPATMEVTEVEIEGQKVKQTGIRAFGTAKILMPDKAALEACIAGKRAPEETDDILGLMGCRGTVALAQAEIKADVEIGIGGAFEAGSAWVYLKRTYLEKSNDYLSGNGETGRSITIESVPPPACTTAVAP